MSKVYYLIFKKHWTDKARDSMLLQKMIGMALLAGLLFLLVGCIATVIYGVDGVQPGERLIHNEGTAYIENVK